MPVGTLAIGRAGAVNAALLAAAILALGPASGAALRRRPRAGVAARQPTRARLAGPREAPPGACIGVLGGGQLGRMPALAAARLGYRCHVLDPEADSPRRPRSPTA